MRSHIIKGMETATPFLPAARRLEYRGFGKRLRALRERRGVSMSRLAARSGLTAGHVLRVERGDSIPTLGVAEKLCACLDASVTELLEPDQGDDDDADRNLRYPR
jgi:transcriptional regulator with XRE-family HTH domain